MSEFIDPRPDPPRTTIEDLEAQRNEIIAAGDTDPGPIIICTTCGGALFAADDTCLAGAVARISTLEAENARLSEVLKQRDWDLAESGALVMSHEGHIAKLESEVARLTKERDEAWDRGVRDVVEHSLRGLLGKPCKEFVDEYVEEVLHRVRAALAGEEV